MLWNVYGPARLVFGFIFPPCVVSSLGSNVIQCLLRRYFLPILIFKTLFLLDVFSNQNSFTGVEKCQGPEGYKIEDAGGKGLSVRRSDCCGKCEDWEKVTDWGQAAANITSVWLRTWVMEAQVLTVWWQVNNIFTRSKHRNIAKLDKNGGGGRHTVLIHPRVRF